MICPKCGALSEVHDTRHVASTDTTRRRRVCVNGHRFVTVEVHLSVWEHAKHRARPYAATLKARRMRYDMDVRAATELHLGWERLAREWSVSRSAVYQAAQRGRAYLAALP